MSKLQQDVIDRTNIEMTTFDLLNFYNDNKLLSKPVFNADVLGVVLCHSGQ
jgi:hypothetical protein